MGVRTITTSSKDPRKVVRHPVDFFQKKTSVFLLDFQARGFFSLNSHFNPAAILSDASRHSQRDQLDKSVSHDAIWLTELLVILITC